MPQWLILREHSMDFNRRITGYCSPISLLMKENISYFIIPLSIIIPNVTYVSLQKSSFQKFYMVKNT